jgi:CRP-like cAMP-binding protein
MVQTRKRVRRGSGIQQLAGAAERIGDSQSSIRIIGRQIMVQIPETYMKCPLFRGIERQNLEKAFICMKVRQKKVGKGAILAIAGDTLDRFGIVLKGGLHIVYDDFWGRRAILEEIGEGGLYGAAFAFSGQPISVSIEASCDSVLLQIPSIRLTETCENACPFHKRLIENALTLLSQNSMRLVEKINIISRKSTREKLLYWLSLEALRAKSSKFTVAFSRQELADYLAVERSAMSAELSHMQKDGLIKYNKKEFVLKKEYIP